MAQYIDKAAVVAEIERISDNAKEVNNTSHVLLCNHLKDFLDTLEVKDPYEQCVQYDSIKASIQAHAETYSFNIESKLFHQLTKEQQKLWRKEIEQACISGGEMGVELAKDARYKENLEVKEVDLDLEITLWANAIPEIRLDDVKRLAKHFFELGLKTQHSSINIPNIDDIFEKDGIDPNSKDAKIFKECYYTALEKLKAQKGEEV